MRYFSALLLTISFNALAESCQTPALMWPEDKIYSQYECQNGSADLCVTTAVWGLNKKPYAVVTGTVPHSPSHPTVQVSSFYSGDNDGSVYEEEGGLGFSKYTGGNLFRPTRYRFELRLSKKTMQTEFKEATAGFFAMGWRPVVTENLKCRKAALVD